MPAIARVCDDVPHLVLRVEMAVGTELLQVREALAFDAKALIVGKMPVQHVELHRGHGVQIALDHFQRHPVA